MKIGLKYFGTVLLMLFAFSCEKDDVTNAPCILGKYIGEYCEGIVIQILDEHKIGRDWEGVYGQHYSNSVVASVDIEMAKSLSNPNSFFSVDSVFYFEYNDGGYPRKQYSVCEPSAFITVTFISKNPCLNPVNNENE